MNLTGFNVVLARTVHTFSHQWTTGHQGFYGNSWVFGIWYKIQITVMFQKCWYQNGN